MRSAVNANAAPSHRKEKPPGFWVVHYDGWAGKKCAGGDDVSKHTLADQLLRLYGFCPVLRLLGNHKHGAGLVSRCKYALAAGKRC